MAPGKKPAQRGASRASAPDRWPGAPVGETSYPGVGVRPASAAPGHWPGDEQGVRQHLLHGRPNACIDLRVTHLAAQRREVAPSIVIASASRGQAIASHEHSATPSCIDLRVAQLAIKRCTLALIIDWQRASSF